MKEEINKMLDEIYKNGYNDGEAHMMGSVLECIKAHMNEEPKEILGHIFLMCLKTAQRWDEEENNEECKS